jgi:hypothetical protein
MEQETETATAWGGVEVEALVLEWSPSDEESSWEWAKDEHVETSDFSYEIEVTYQPYLLVCECKDENGCPYDLEIRYDEQVGMAEIVDQEAYDAAMEAALDEVSSALDEWVRAKRAESERLGYRNFGEISREFDVL